MCFLSVHNSYNIMSEIRHNNIISSGQTPNARLTVLASTKNKLSVYRTPILFPLLPLTSFGVSNGGHRVKVQSLTTLVTVFHIDFAFGPFSFTELVSFEISRGFIIHIFKLFRSKIGFLFHFESFVYMTGYKARPI